MIIRNSIKQLMRTPVKTLFFFILLAGAIMFFMLGYGLHVIAGRNIERLEKSLVTIGTVEQKPSTPNTLAFLRTEDGSDYTVIGNPPEYGSPIPLSVLEFEGADYVLKPETRPLYIAYDPGYVVSWNPTEEERRHTYQSMIIEMEPLEDCEAGQGCGPVRIKIKKALCGKPDRDEIWFDSPDTPPMMLLAGKTYIVSLWQQQGMPSDPHINEYIYVPSLVTRAEQFTKNGEWIEDTMRSDTLWDEVTPGFYETHRGRRWQAAVENYQRALHVIPVVPTNGTKLLMPFFNGEARIVEGQDISQEAYRSGEKVCLVQRGFAANNGLTVGDDLHLPLYYAVYGSSSGSWFYNPSGICTNVNSLINAKGECYELFEDSVFRIIGVYDSPAATYNLSEYDLGANAVVIPAASVKNSDENNLVRVKPMMFGSTTSFQIPNGQIEKYTAAWDAQGITGLDIKLYDRGYTKIKAGLEDMNKTASFMFIAGIVTTLFVLVLFCHLFISKQRKRTAIERSLGMSKQLCAASLLSGLLFVAIAAYAFGSVSGYVLTIQTVKQSNIAQSQESFDAAYSNWRYTVDDSAISKTVVSTDGAAGGIPLAAIVIPATFFIALAMLRGNLKSEPLKMLGEK